jgi:hypothetical protein
MLKSKCKQLGSKRGHHIKGGAWELDGGEEDETHTVTIDVQSNQNLCVLSVFWASKSLTLWRSVFPRKHTSTLSELHSEAGIQEGCYKMQRELRKRSHVGCCF